MVPTMLFANSLSEKDWWPHSCASTQTPVRTAPCAYQYNGQRMYDDQTGALGLEIHDAQYASTATVARSDARCVSEM